MCINSVGAPFCRFVFLSLVMAWETGNVASRHPSTCAYTCMQMWHHGSNANGPRSTLAAKNASRDELDAMHAAASDGRVSRIAIMRRGCRACSLAFMQRRMLRGRAAQGCARMHACFLGLLKSSQCGVHRSNGWAALIKPNNTWHACSILSTIKKGKNDQPMKAQPADL